MNGRATRARRRVATVLCILAWALPALALPAAAQQKRLEQDPSLNNLVHAEGYETGAPGELGRVRKVGHGPQAMILIAGAGFGDDIWDAFMAARVDAYTMYAVTLPGFGGTAAPPMPPPGTSYGEQTWTMGAVKGVERVIVKERLERPIVVAHWIGATQVAVQLALRNPVEVKAVVIISGVAGAMPPFGDNAPALPALPERIAMVDERLAPRWFKTVTRDTWDDNNFYPGDYARHPVRALQLWRMAAEPPLPVWVRYLCELYAQDSTLRLDELEMPMLLLQPGFDEDFWFEPGQDYMRGYTHGTWEGVEQLNERITVQTVPDARVFIMDDEPEALDRAVDNFLAPIVSR